MQSFLTHFTYAGIVIVLLASGFGLPIPEDIPLITGGYLCYQGLANIWIMTPIAFTAVVLADCIVYWLGRRYGHHVPRLPLLNKYLSPQRLAKAEAAFHEHGGKTLFTARFLPGLRTATFFTAGTFRIPFWKFLAFDGFAAILSVPTITLAAYFFGEQIDHVRKFTWQGQIFLAVFTVVAIVGFFVWRRYRKPATPLTLPLQDNPSATTPASATAKKERLAS